MENRIIIKSIQFINNSSEDLIQNDIKIKLYHNKINLMSDIIWNYKNNDIINWKFIINYDSKLSIDFIILENDNDIIGHGLILPKKITKQENDTFPEAISYKINIEKNNNIICILNIEEYIIPKNKKDYYKCGEGWSLPDKYPQLNIFPYKNKNDIFQNIRLIDVAFSEESYHEIYSEAFIRIINNNNNKPPICFGIIAPDNYGKSLLLQNLKKKLGLHDNTVVIEFNPWNFEAADIIWASILISINNALELKFGKFNLNLLRLNKFYFPNIRSVVIFALKILIPLISLIIFCVYGYFQNNLFSIVFSVGIGSFILFFKDYYTIIKNLIFSISDTINKRINKPNWTKQLGFMNEIKEEFIDFINPIIKYYDCKLILLIDDLDKCSIEKIYSVIKVLSLLKYSDCPIYIFLSYDSIKINDAITSYYKNKNLINTYEGTHLLDKLINIPFCLPEKNIVENMSLIDEYIKNLKNYSPKSPPLSSSKNVFNFIKSNLNINLSDDESDNDTENENTIISIINDAKEINLEPLQILKNEKGDTKIFEIETLLNNNTNLTFYHLQNYYKCILKMEKKRNPPLVVTKIKELKTIINEKFIELKNILINDFYIGLDNEEITLLQHIIEETKYSDNSLTNNKIVKIINLYSIARFLLPPYLKNKKHKLFHLILITENWQKIIINIYYEIKKVKLNLNSDKIRECFEDKDLLFFYLNNDKLIKNDELVLYLSKFEIKIIDFIDLEFFMINMDRCILS